MAGPALKLSPWYGRLSFYGTRVPVRAREDVGAGPVTHSCSNYLYTRWAVQQFSPVTQVCGDCACSVPERRGSPRRRRSCVSTQRIMTGFECALCGVQCRNNSKRILIAKAFSGAGLPPAAELEKRLPADWRNRRHDGAARSAMVRQVQYGNTADQYGFNSDVCGPSREVGMFSGTLGCWPFLHLPGRF